MKHQITIATFYQFHSLVQLDIHQPALLALMRASDVKGTILLTPEGVNATISGEKPGLEMVLAYLNETMEIPKFPVKYSHYPRHPFQRTKVKIKDEMIELGIPVDPTVRTGEHLDAEEWNALLRDPDTVIIDTRNAYESQHGAFKGAIRPDLESFKQFPKFTENELAAMKQRKIAMYCTGGVRCEKYATYMLEQGFEAVYQLNGGILKYLEDVPEDKSMWEGACYVFDERLAVTHGVKPIDNPDDCMVCGASLTPKEKLDNSYIPGKQCPHCSVPEKIS